MDQYDRTIRTFIPNYERMLAESSTGSTATCRAGGLVVDLGAGTGALGSRSSTRCRTCASQLVDVDPNMLEVAAERCAAHAGRCRAAPRPVRGLAARAATPSSPRSLSTTSPTRARSGSSTEHPRRPRAGRPRRRRRRAVLSRRPRARRMSRTGTRTWRATASPRPRREPLRPRGREEDLYVPLPDELALIAAAGSPSRLFLARRAGRVRRVPRLTGQARSKRATTGAWSEAGASRRSVGSSVIEGGVTSAGVDVAARA